MGLHPDTQAISKLSIFTRMSHNQLKGKAIIIIILLNKFLYCCVSRSFLSLLLFACYCVPHYLRVQFNVKFSFTLSTHVNHNIVLITTKNSQNYFSL